MVQCHHHFAAPAKTHAAVDNVIGRSAAVRTAVNVDHHWTFAPIAQRWGPDIQIEIETILTYRSVFRRHWLNSAQKCEQTG